MGIQSIVANWHPDMISIVWLLDRPIYLRSARASDCSQFNGRTPWPWAKISGVYLTYQIFFGNISRHVAK
jgi:hypothetical protein